MRGLGWGAEERDVNHFLRLQAALLAPMLIVLAGPGAAYGAFFLGAPTSSFNTTSGTVVSTPSLVANNPNQEIDVNGPFTVQNAGAPIQTSSFNISWPLDPTFNGGVAIPNMQLQINQSGFVDVPNLGQIYGWTIQGDIVDANGVSQGTVTAQWPGAPTPFGPGLNQPFGPLQTFSVTPFTYTPSPGSALVLTFGSDFDGLTSNNLYTWDFPLSLQVAQAPEPGSLGMLGAGALVMIRRRHPRKSPSV